MENCRAPVDNGHKALSINEPCADLGKLLLIVLSPEDRRCVGPNLIAPERSLASASLHACISRTACSWLATMAQGTRTAVSASKLRCTSRRWT